MSTLTVERSELKKFSTMAATVVDMAMELKWKVQWQNASRRVARVTSSDHRATFNVPTTNVNANRVQQWVRILVRNSDEEAILDFTDTIQDKARRLTLGLEGIGPRDNGPRGPLGETLAERVGIEAANAAREVAEMVRNRPPKEASKADEEAPERTLVSSTPWMVRRGGVDGGNGRMYESPNVIHEVYSDGSESYRCRHCRYSNENPRSVSGHAARSKGHPRAEADHQVLPVRNYEATDITRQVSPNRRLVADLTAALDSIEGWASLDASALAQLVVTRMDENRPDRAPAEPLSADQVLDRISALVDNGRLAEMHQQIARLTEHIANLTEQVRVERLERAEVEEKVKRQQENMHALRELLLEAEAS